MKINVDKSNVNKFKEFYKNDKDEVLKDEDLETELNRFIEINLDLVI